MCVCHDLVFSKGPSQLTAHCLRTMPVLPSENGLFIYSMQSDSCLAYKPAFSADIHTDSHVLCDVRQVKKNSSARSNVQFMRCALVIARKVCTYSACAREACGLHKFSLSLMEWFMCKFRFNIIVVSWSSFFVILRTSAKAKVHSGYKCFHTNEKRPNAQWFQNLITKNLDYDS